MPIEINELIIKATITGQTQSGTRPPLDNDAKRLQKIVDDVLKKIKNKNER